MTSGFALDRRAACECDQIGPEERVYSRFFSQEQAIIAEMRMAAYLMLEGLGMIRGWLRNLHAALNAGQFCASLATLAEILSSRRGVPAARR